MGLLTDLLGDGGSGTYALAQRADSVILLGDSITVNNIQSSTGSERWSSRGFWTWAASRNGWRLGVMKMAGVGGNTTTQMLARLATDVIAWAPGWCVVQGGINDIIGGVPTATVTANLQSIYSQLIAARIMPILTTVTPASSAAGLSTGERTVWFEVNAWIRKYAQDYGLPVADWAPVLTDPATGYANTTYFSDGVHPNTAGAARMGAVMADTLATLPIRSVGPLSVANNDPANLLTNGLFDGSTGGLATSWSVGQSGASAPNWTSSKVASTGNVLAPWQQEVIVSGNGRLLHSSLAINSGYAVGDVLFAAIEIEMDSDLASYLPRLQIEVYGESDNAVCPIYEDTPSPSDTNQRLSRAVFRTPNVTVGAATTSVQVTVPASSATAGTFRVRRAVLAKAPNPTWVAG